MLRNPETINYYIKKFNLLKIIANFIKLILIGSLWILNSLRNSNLALYN